MPLGAVRGERSLVTGQRSPSPWKRINLERPASDPQGQGSGEPPEATPQESQ